MAPLSASGAAPTRAIRCGQQAQPVAPPRYWLLAPARFLFLGPNEPKALRWTQDDVAEGTQGDATRFARWSPNEPEPICRARHDPAERTQAGSARCVRSRPNEPDPFQPRRHNVAERTRGGGVRRAWSRPIEPEEPRVRRPTSLRPNEPRAIGGSGNGAALDKQIDELITES